MSGYEYEIDDADGFHVSRARSGDGGSAHTTDDDRLTVSDLKKLRAPHQAAHRARGAGW